MYQGDGEIDTFLSLLMILKLQQSRPSLDLVNVSEECTKANDVQINRCGNTWNHPR